MTRIVLTRHGHVEGIDPPRFRGRADLPLSKRGELQAEVLAVRLAGVEHPTAIYSGPLGRCLRTAGILGRSWTIEPQSTPSLQDLDYGDWQGQAHAEIEPEQLSLWYSTPDRVRFPHGESLQDMALRAADLLRMLAQRHPRDTVLLVGHASVNRVLLLELLRMPLSSYWSLTQSPCNYTVVDVAEKSTTALVLNDVAHLAHIDGDNQLTSPSRA